MKILLTGANGLLGQKLTALLDNDPTVSLTATARRPPAVPLRRSNFHVLDVTEPLAVNAVISNTLPDVIIHTAAMTQVDQCETDRETCWKNNVTAVEYLVRAAEQAKAHLIHLSTDFIFDGKLGPLDESALPNPLSHYGVSKLASEEVVKKSTCAWSIVRTVLVYGVTRDMSRSNIVLWVKKSLEDSKSIQVVTDQWRTPTLAEDLAIGCSLVAGKKAAGIFNISGDEMMTPYDMAVRTASFFKLNASLIKPTDSNHFKQPAQRPLKTGFIIDKARKQLGYQPRSFEEGLALINSQLKAI